MRQFVIVALQPSGGILPFLLLFVLVFAVILAWTFLPGRRRSLERESLLPLQEEENQHAR